MADRRLERLTSLDEGLLQSEALLKALFTYPLEQGPLYLEQILAHVNVHVNILYGDPLYILLCSLRDVLGGIKPHTACDLRSALDVKSPFNLLNVESPDRSSRVRKALASYQLPTLSDSSSVEWCRQGHRLTELGVSHEHCDAQLRSGTEVEMIMRNGRSYFDLLIKYGLKQERLEYAKEHDAARYFSVVFQLFKQTHDPRIRSYALDFFGQLVALGLDPYTDLVFDTLHELIKAGSNKTLDDLGSAAAEAFETNYCRIVELLQALLSVGFDLNYQYMRTLTFPEQFGVPTHEATDALFLESVQYTAVSVTALCAIYNRADVLAWLLHFGGPLPLNMEEEEEENIAPRTLDIDSTVMKVRGDKLTSDDDYVTMVVNLYSKPEQLAEQCDMLTVHDEEGEEDDDLTPIELAFRHRSNECHQLLLDYQKHLSKEWLVFDPTVHDMTNIFYTEQNILH